LFFCLDRECFVTFYLFKPFWEWERTRVCGVFVHNAHKHASTISLSRGAYVCVSLFRIFDSMKLSQRFWGYGHEESQIQIIKLELKTPLWFIWILSWTILTIQPGKSLSKCNLMIRLPESYAQKSCPNQFWYKIYNDIHMKRGSIIHTNSRQSKSNVVGS